jgi:predicted negative regulator of RcsB-dependent stress response
MRHFKYLSGTVLALLVMQSSPVLANDHNVASQRLAGASAECLEAPNRDCLIEEALRITQNLEPIWQNMEDVERRDLLLSSLSSTSAKIGQLDEALTLARQIDAPWRRTMLQKDIVDAQLKAGLTANALRTAREIGISRDRVSALISIAEAQLEPELFAEAIHAARSIEGDSRAGEIGRVVQAQVKADQLLEVMVTVRDFFDSSERADVIVKIANTQIEMGEFSEALSTTDLIEDPEMRTIILSDIAKAQTRAQRFTEALSTVQQIENTQFRARELYLRDVLIGIVGAQVDAGLYRDAYDTAQRIVDPPSLVSSLIAIASAQSSPTLFAEALSGARSIENVALRAYALGRIASATSSQSLAIEALTLARSIEDPHRRAISLSQVAAMTQAGDAILDEALELIENDRGGSLALATISQTQIDAGNYDSAIATAWRLRDNRRMLLRIIQSLIKAGANEAAQSLVERTRNEEYYNHLLRTMIYAQSMQGYHQEALNNALSHESLVFQADSLRNMVIRHLEAERFSEALIAARNIEIPDYRADALRRVAEARPDIEIFIEAVSAARNIEDDAHRAFAFAVIASSAPLPDGDAAIEITQDVAYSAEDARAWYFYDQAGGDTIRDVYRNLIFERQNTQWMLRITGIMNLIADDTPPDRILTYVDQVLMEIQNTREVLTLIAGVMPMTSSGQGELYTLWLLNAARSQYQSVSHAYADLGRDGFRRLSPQKSAFHAIGLDASRVEKWIHADGREYVYQPNHDGQMTLVFDGINNGTFNYCNLPACHLILDVLPWVKWGATLNDPSTAQDRAILFRQSLLLTNYSWDDLLGFF